MDTLIEIVRKTNLDAFKQYWANLDANQ